MPGLPAVGAIAAVVLACGCASEGQGDADGGADASAWLVDDELRVEAGGYLAFRVEAASGIELLDPQDPYGDLPQAGREAVDAAPEWIRERLLRTLSRLDDACAEAFAAQILASDAPLRDEVAWSVAVTDAPMLAWMAEGGNEGLFLENAEAVYAMDGALAYARIVELDGGERTTLEMTGADGVYELEPEMYYWDVVYPRGYFELPTRVDGVFWRTFLAEDEEYGTALLDYVADAADVNAAAVAVGEWIQSFMTFGYGSNELQPIDIYYEQLGSCGEYSILTTAAARTVLVPTESASARADDHEWNEYWDGRWIMWDNSLGEIGSNPHYPYLDWPEIFDDDLYDGAGVLGQVAHVFRYRSDDAIFASEVEYTPVAEADVVVTDALGEAVEGARVTMLAGPEYGWVPCTWGYTDASGSAAFLLGNSSQYHVEVSHDLLGTGSGVTAVGADDVGPIEVEVALEVPYPRSFEDAGDPDGEVGLALTLAVVTTTQRRINEITEDYELGLTHEFELPGGAIDVFLLDEDGFAAFAAGEPFQAFAPGPGTADAALDLSVPAQGTRYLVLDNRMWPVSDKTIAVRLELEN